MMWSTPRLRNIQVSSRSAVLDGIVEKREIIAGAVAMMVETRETRFTIISAARLLRAPTPRMPYNCFMGKKTGMRWLNPTTKPS